MPPLDSQHVLEYTALFSGMVALFCLNSYFEKTQYRRKAALVRSNLTAKRCMRCGGTLGDWDGRFQPGDAHLNPGGYLPIIRVRCTSCHAEQAFYIYWDGRPINREIVWGGLTSHDGEVQPAAPADPARGDGFW